MNVVLKQGDRLYVDSNFLNSCQNIIDNAEMKHLGYGYFYLDTPNGQIDFDRMDGVKWEGMVGRGHEIKDNRDGRLIRKLFDNMEIQYVDRVKITMN